MSGSNETFRRPRCRLVIAGNVIGGCHSVELMTSSFGQAGSFFVQLANRGGSVGGDSAWYDAETIDASIQMGFLPPGMPEGSTGWQEMMSGRVDRIRLDPVSGTMMLEGRDYAARLLDLPITENFLNNSSSEVAQQLADRCGLSATIDDTVAMIGQYYQIEHARSALTRFSRFSTAWDLLCNLAQLEQFDVWVSGSTLYFQASKTSSQDIRNVTFQSADQDHAAPLLNLSSLELERTLALSGGLPVSVSSWNSRQRKRIVASAGSGSSNAAAVVNIVRPNLLADTAQSLANGVYSQTAGHERTLSGRMPGDLTLSPRDGIRLSGVSRIWDGNYRVESVEREMSAAGGFTQRFTAKTISA